MRDWQGPISIALLVPYPVGDLRATQCRTRLIEYVQNSARNYPASVSLSLLYSLEEAANNHCNITDDMTGQEPAHFDPDLWNSRYKGKVYVDIWDGEFPVNNLRNLAKQQVCAIFLFLFLA